MMQKYNFKAIHKTIKVFIPTFFSKMNPPKQTKAQVSYFIIKRIYKPYLLLIIYFIITTVHEMQSFRKKINII